ncbi:hypothetical protein R1flu_026063 [Riccia fluitans]|uniref:Uncharacterized protein n=1 Tax=Riccia fluitans TaxID=41844 RepID=A0ABD1XEW6_9MARC
MDAFRKASQDPERFRFGQNLDKIQERLTKYVKSIPGHLLEEYELWLKSSQFESWTSERETFGLPYRLQTEEDVRQVYRNRAKAWDEWFRRPPQLRNPSSLSWRYKNCEPISNNMFIRIQHLQQLTKMDRTTRIGHGVSGNIFLVGFLDHSLNKTLGSHEVVFYVAKRMKDLPGISGYDEALKEMSTFPISHPAVVAPVAGLLDRVTPTLVFPWWNGG